MTPSSPSRTADNESGPVDNTKRHLVSVRPPMLVSDESLRTETAEALEIAFDLVADIGGVDDHILNRAERNGLRLARYVLNRSWLEESSKCGRCGQPYELHPHTTDGQSSDQPTDCPAS